MTAFLSFLNRFRSDLDFLSLLPQHSHFIGIDLLEEFLLEEYIIKKILSK